MTREIHSMKTDLLGCNHQWQQTTFGGAPGYFRCEVCLTILSFGEVLQLTKENTARIAAQPKRRIYQEPFRYAFLDCRGESVRWFTDREVALDYFREWSADGDELIEVIKGKTIALKLL